MSAVYTNNLIINSGANFNTTFELTNSDGTALDLTGYTGASQLRKTYSSTDYVSFSLSFIAPRTTGKIGIALTSGQTSSLKPGRYVYDVLITTSTGTKSRVVEGMALVREGVTK